MLGPDAAAFFIPNTNTMTREAHRSTSVCRIGILWMLTLSTKRDEAAFNSPYDGAPTNGNNED